MMRMKTLSTLNGGGRGNVGGGGATESGAEWEVRPGGMLVQKRNPDSDRTSALPPTIRVRVKYGSTYHEVNISSQSTFGELKKILAGRTGLHHQDQKLMYKDKERDSKAFLDISGVKDKSKIVLVEDPISHEKRLLEMRKNAKMEKASKSISQISLEVDRLAGQVSAFESVIGKGGRVEEKSLLNLIELLMNQLLKLDGITAEGDVKLQRKMQVKRVQKYVETLDLLKIKNSTPDANRVNKPAQNQNVHSKSQRQTLSTIKEHQPTPFSGHFPTQQQQQQQPSRNSASGAIVVTTQWETFDSAPPLVPASSTSTSISTASEAHQQPKFPWDFFN